LGMKQRSPGLVAVISAPSGTGKTTICRNLLRRHRDYVFSISATTRPARSREKEGIDYYFVSDREFDSLVKDGRLAEWANVYGFRYGTLLSEIEKALKENNVILCDIDVQGGMSLKARIDGAVTIFLIPPSESELKRRLSNRRTDTAAQRKVRLETAVWEMGFWPEYDYIVINDDLKKATAEVDTIIAAERARTTRRSHRRFWRPSQARLLGL
jgi:guanylate kinase